MARRGWYDPTLVSRGIFDPEAEPRGILDKDQLNPSLAASIVDEECCTFPSRMVYATLALGLLPVVAPWADRYDEKVVSSVVAEEDAWLPPVLHNYNTSVSLLVGGTNQTTPPPFVDEDYPYNRPVIWSAQVIRLTWGQGDEVVAPPTLLDEDYQHKASTVWPQSTPRLTWPDEDVVVALQGVDDEWAPKLPAKQPSNGLVLWLGSDEGTVVPVEETQWLPSSTKASWLNPAFGLAAGIQDEIERLTVDDEGWLPQPTRTRWQSVVITDPFDGIVIPVVPVFEEDSWFPVAPFVSVSIQPLVGGSEPVAPEPLVVLDDELWLQLNKVRSEWSPRLVHDVSDNISPPVPVYEEDAWAPVAPYISTSVKLVVGGSGPIPSVPPEPLQDDSIWLQLSKIKDGWHPRLVSDPFSDIVPNVAVIEDEFWLTSLTPPCVISVVVPWAYSAGEDGAPTSPIETEWSNPVKPIALKYDARFVFYDEGTLASAVVNIGEEEFRPVVLAPQRLRSLSIWGLDQQESAPIITGIINEDYEPVRIVKVGRVTLPNYWQFEQNEFLVPLPPEVCIEGPVSVTITVETPGGNIVTLEGPMQVTVVGESPLASAITLEGASPLSTQIEIPTETQCND